MLPRGYRWRPDPGRHELRETTVAMVAVLSTFGSVLLVKRAAHLDAGLVVLAVVLAWTLTRVEWGTDFGSRMAGVVVLPSIAMGAIEVGALMIERPDVGGALFVTCVSATIWIRRSGPGPPGLERWR